MTARRFVALAALLTMTACGVQPTGVVGAGPAPVIPDTRNGLVENDLILYFLFDGQLHAVARPSSKPVSVGMAISELLNGPDDGERAKGATSLLPPISAPVSVTLGGTPTVTVPFAIAGCPRSPSPSWPHRHRRGAIVNTCGSRSFRRRWMGRARRVVRPVRR
jgi:hypothetical protein